MTDPRDMRLERAVDAVLGEALRPPQVPRDLRTRVRAAASRSPAPDLLAWRERIDREAREQQRALSEHYVRLRRATLGTLIGMAFAAGAAVAVGMPWLRAHLGDYAPLATSWAAVAFGLGLIFREPLRALMRRWE